mmetsp:Transcript_24721/g.32274  ORF Transcript_24721/g.32274 Transcript_24721/m.32274 type:complete len:409 (-) Transcript_24721:59-1285(-)
MDRKRIIGQHHQDDERYFLVLAKLFQKSGKIDKAIAVFLKILEGDQENVKVHFDLASCYSKSKMYSSAVQHFSKAFSLSGCIQVECLTNIAGIYIKLGDPSSALEHCEQALCCLGSLCDGNRVEEEVGPLAMYNLNVALRQLGRQEEAVRASWAVVMHADASQGGKNLGWSPVTQEHSATTAKSLETICVVCVKWGVKYGPEYVNNLFAAIKRHMPPGPIVQYVCFTDDATGIVSDSSIEILPLPDSLDWSGWWWKAYLFSPTCPLKGRVWYFDLDTVIIRSLEPLLSYKGRYATLTTSEMVNEQRQGGYNSSIMIWPAGEFSEVFTVLKSKYKAIHRSIYKFDHWLEMMIVQADLLQEHYPNLIAEYGCLKQCSHDLFPEECSIVCFPLQPKPHECLHIKWISENWA